MSSFPDSPANTRRLRGTKFFVIRNYWAVTMLGMASITAIPWIFSARVRKNIRYIQDNFLPSKEMADRRRFELSAQFSSIKPEDVVEMRMRYESENQGTVNMGKYDGVFKDGKPDGGKV